MVDLPLPERPTSAIVEPARDGKSDVSMAHRLVARTASVGAG